MKKNIALYLFLILITPTLALAAWTDEFLDDYEKLGIDHAVENSLENDVTPEEILVFIITNEKINDKSVLKALYCAGVDRDIVREAAIKLGITEQALYKALEESIAECGSKLVLDDRENSGILASPARPRANRPPRFNQPPPRPIQPPPEIQNL